MNDEKKRNTYGRPDEPWESVARLYAGYSLLFSLVGGALAWLAEADYIFGIIPPFVMGAAKLGAALAALPLAGVCAFSLVRAGRLPAMGNTIAGFLISLAGLPVFTVGFVAVTNSWLDRSEGVMQPVTVTRRWDRRHGDGYRRSKTPELHDAYVYLAPLDPAGGELRVPGDYASTRGLKAGDRYGLERKKGFWGLPHVAIKVR